MAAGPTPDTSIPSIEAYKPSEYAETSWPTIEVAPVESVFRPAEFEVIAQPVFETDPMFAVFDGESSVSTQGFTSATSFESDPSLESETLQAESSDAFQAESVESSEDAQEMHADDQQEEHPTESTEETPEGFIEAATVELEPSEGSTAAVVDQESHEAALTAAREEGYALGITTSRQEVDAACAEMRQEFSVLVEDFKAQAQEILMEYERKAVELALHVARRMLGTVVETQREYVVSVIQEAMQSAGTAAIKTIRVSPRDFDFLVNQGAGQQLKIEQESPGIFTSDETIKSGCIIVTSSGEVDFDLDAAWSRLHTKVVQGPQS